MFVVTVTFEIKDEYLDDFMAAMKAQAHNSLTREEGCLQFDVCRDQDAPERIFLGDRLGEFFISVCFLGNNLWFIGARGGQGIFIRPPLYG